MSIPTVYVFLAADLEWLDVDAAVVAATASTRVSRAAIANRRIDERMCLLLERNDSACCDGNRVAACTVVSLEEEAHAKRQCMLRREPGRYAMATSLGRS